MTYDSPYRAAKPTHVDTKDFTYYSVSNLEKYDHLLTVAACGAVDTIIAAWLANPATTICELDATRGVLRVHLDPPNSLEAMAVFEVPFAELVHSCADNADNVDVSAMLRELADEIDKGITDQ